MSDPYAWRSNMDIAPPELPPRSPLAQLKPGPAPTGHDRVFDAAYGFLGGTPNKRSAASALAGLFDVGTLGMATGAYDGGAELARGGGPQALGMALMPGAKVAGPAAKAAGKAATEAVQGIRAFHGSPHDFDRFDMSKIGTGEGAQAYGHGLYFAESEGVARSYRDNLAPRNAPPGQNVALGWLKWHGDKDKAVTALRAEIDRVKGADVTELRQALAHLESGTVFDQPGRMYEVNIKASPDDFLDWDKPLSQQSEKVRAAVEKMAGPEYAKSNLLTGANLAPGPGGNLKSFTDAGIPGIKYLDQGSRGAGEGSRNYVAFDDSLIEILRKYGLMPPAVAGGAIAAQDGGDQ